MKKNVDLWVHQSPTLKKLIMELKIAILIIVVGISNAIATPAEGSASELQQNQVTGTITDSQTAEAMPGVNILVKGTTVGAMSDINGKYSITVPDQKAVIVFSFIGYINQEMPVAGKSVIDVKLVSDVLSLEEVVVIGYGTQRKVTLTGSVTSVKPAEVQSNPTTSVTNSLAGLLPGLVAMTRSGEPGKELSSVLIRGRSTTGNTSPLVVVDGIQGVEGWERINPDDIESISILKDAAAAIYGSRAANGVILITTKRGSTGKPLFNISINQGINQPTRFPELASSYTYAEWVNDHSVINGQPPIYTDEELQKFKNGSDPNYPNTNWAKESIRKFNPLSQYNMSVRGGTENINYSVSGSTTHETGVLKESSLDFRTYSIRSNLDARVNEFLKIGFDINTAFQNGNYPRTTYSSFRMVPYLPVFWPNGLPSNPPSDTGSNPFVLGNEKAGNTNIIDEQLGIKASFDFSVPWIKGLGIDGYFAYNRNQSTEKEWIKPFYLYDYDSSTDTYTAQLRGSVKLPQLTQTFDKSHNSLINLRIKYEKQFDEHKINAFIAGEQVEGYSTWFSAFRRDFPSASIDEIFAGSLVDQLANGNSAETGRQNLLGRFSYNFREKYLMDFNFRYDGSAAFPQGQQFGFFPGISLGWRISQENFMKKYPFISELKLRGSWGQIGNDRISPFQFLRLYTLGKTGYSYGVPPVASLGLVEGVTPNPNITWEVLNTTNIGLDARFWNGLLGFEIDVFKQRRSNILTTRALEVPKYTGLSFPAENIGVVENKGIEVQIKSEKIINDFALFMTANFAYARNKVIDVSEAQNVPEWQKAEGGILGAGLYFLNDGIMRTQEDLASAPVRAGMKVGDLRYKDINSDGVIDAADQVRLNKTNIPEITFGLNFTVNYKRFSMWTNFAGQTRAWQYYHLNTRIGQNGFAEIVENRYRPGSMDSKYPIIPTLEPGTSGEVSGLISDFWLKNASFLRLKTLELSYNFPVNLLSKLKINNLRVFANGNNLFTLDKMGSYKFDPESSDERGGAYPQSKIYNFGIQLSW